MTDEEYGIIITWLYTNDGVFKSAQESRNAFVELLQKLVPPKKIPPMKMELPK